MRALLHAALGERASAQEDIAWVKAAQESTPEALAKAALAEAVLLERAGNLEGLRGLLAQNRSLLLENPSPRERALVRAYQRMLKANAKPSSVYRASAPKEGPPENEKPGLADWISKIAPSAAPFAGAPREREAGFAAGASSENILSPPHEEALKSAEARKAAFKSRATKGVKLVLLSYAGCIVMFLAIWKFLQPDPKTSRAPVVHRPAPPPPAGEPNLLLSLVLPLAVTIALVIGIFALQMRKVRQTTRALVAARVSIARGDVSAGALALEDLSKSRYRGPAAEAHLVLARLAESHGELDKALRYCEAAIAMFPGEGDRAAANVVFPSLLAERAFLFAAKGRSADASAEMDLLTQSYPSFTEQRGAAVRVALAQHLQRGDFEAAARLANQCPDLSVFARDELLADLALVVAHPSSTSVEEVERLEDELRDPKVCRFIAAVSPSLMEAFQRARRNLHADGETPARDHQAAEEVPAMT
jgi:tetratricopeptide (TPR) repeat protein